MGRLREAAWRIAATVRRRRLDTDTTAELQFHLEMETRAGIRRGLPPDEARRQARLRAGSVAASLEAVRDERGLGPLDGVLRDLRHACATLRRQPGFAASAGAALALSVALTTLVVALADGVLRRPLPYPEPDRLVRLFEQSQRNPTFPVSIGNYLELRQSVRTLAGIALYTRDDLQLMHGERPERLASVAVTDTFFPTLGIMPALGRNFAASDLRASARVVILSYGLWATRFSRDPAIVGRAIRLNREAWTVVGIMPDGFQHVGGAYRSPLQGDTVALWRPLALDLPDQGLRQWHFTNAVARLKPGVTAARARDDVNGVMTELRHRYKANEGVTLKVVPLAQAVTASSRWTVQLLLAAAAVVLLIAGVNIAGLCVARVLARRQELAIRQALGAGRWRLVRAVLSENLVVGVVGGAIGLAIAAALLPLLRSILPADFPRLHEVRLSAAAVAFAWAASLSVSMIAGVVPAVARTRADVSVALGAGQGRTASPNRRVRRLRSGLVVAEVALACFLCVGTLLLVRSAFQLAARNHGFDPRGVLTFSLSLPRTSYKEPEQAERLYEDLLDRWSSLPGVRSVGVATNIPWTGYDENTSFDLVGRQAPSGDSPQARFQAASRGFFRALRMRLVAGRLLADTDGPRSPRVVVVNEALARRWFPAGDIVGQRLDIWGDQCTVVGVVGDIRDDPAGPPAEPAFWWPIAQQPFTDVRAVVRSEGDPLAIAASIADVVRQADRELPLAEVRTLEDIQREALGERRFALWFFQTFAVLAVVLAAFALYGVLAYDVQLRRRELGIRMAVGATRYDVAGMVLADGLRLAGVGALVGAAAAPAGLKVLSTLLVGVTSGDPASLVAGPLVLGSIAVLASAVPAFRASRSDALAALREQ